MKLQELGNSLEAVVLTGEEKLNMDVSHVFGCDLMSDVLSMVSGEKTVLLTGLTNLQAVRTAEMIDIKCIIFVRGKTPNKEMVEYANDKGICLMTTKNTLFISCGILYNSGLKGVELYNG